MRDVAEPRRLERLAACGARYRSTTHRAREIDDLERREPWFEPRRVRHHGDTVAIDVESDGAAPRPPAAGDQTDERALPRAVRTDEPVHAPALETEVDFLERRRPAVALRQRRGRDDGRALIHRP